MPRREGFFSKGGLRDSKNILTRSFYLWVVLFSPAETQRQITFGFHGFGMVGASPFLASSVLSAAWYHHPGGSGGRGTLAESVLETSSSGFEPQGHHLLAVCPSASYTPSLGLSVAVLTLELLRVNTYTALRIVPNIHKRSVSAATINNDNEIMQP